MKQHDTEWFAKQEASLQEPLKNTVRYVCRWAIFKICTGILLIWGIIELISLRKELRKFNNFTTDYLRNGRATTNDGAPGAGKTFLGSNAAYFLAVERWEELKTEYFTQKSMVSEWLRSGETDKLEAFKSLEESYLFYKERENGLVPCLISTIPLREYGTGRMSYQITPEIFLQKDRVPEYTVFFNDEIGEDQGVDKSDTTNPNYLAFWRFPRHFFDGLFMNTNQDGSQAAIAVRRSTDFNNHIYGQEWVRRPTALENRFKRREQRYLKRLNAGKYSVERAEYIAQELYYSKKYYRTIGFREITCQLMTTKGALVGEKSKIILPAIGGVQYDDRTYRKQYKCKDQPIELRGWEKLTIEEYDHEEFNTTLGDGKERTKRRGG